MLDREIRPQKITGEMKNNKHVLKAIRQRRSIRKYTGRAIPMALLRQIIEAGTWAPSGLNNQPWRFAIVGDPSVKENIAELTRYSGIVQTSSALIIVFLGTGSSYNKQKDTQAIGACIQNILLAAHSMGIGACWLGEILKNKRRLCSLVGLKKNLQLQAVIALGYPAEAPRRARKPLESFILKSII